MKEHICDATCTHSKRPFLTMHVHDRTSSVRDCTASIADMFSRCKESRMGFASSNHGWGASFPQINTYSQKNGVKPVYGIEFYLNRYRDRMFELLKKSKELKEYKAKTKEEKANVDDELRLVSYELDEIKKYNHICIYAKNLHGFHSIIELHNTASLNNFYNKPLISLDDLFNAPKDHKGDRGLIVTSACLAGVVSQEILKNKVSRAEEHTLVMKEEFHDDWYLEIQPHELEEQRIVNREIIKISKKTGVQFCIGTDSHYLNKSYSKSHEIFLLLQGEQKVADIGKKIWSVTFENSKGETRKKKVEPAGDFLGLAIDEVQEGLYIKKNKGIVSREDKWDAKVKEKKMVNKVWMIEGADLSFKDEHELRAHAKQYEEIRDVVDTAIETNKDIYEKIESFSWDKDLKLPTSDRHGEELLDLCVAGMKRLGLSKDPVYVDRLKRELKVIRGGGLSSYFILLNEMISYAKDNVIPIGPGRGSGGASLVLYLMGITRVDPVKWNFNFERFLNEKKVSSDSERIRFSLDDGTIIDYRPNDDIKLKNGLVKKAKDISEGDEL